MAPLTTLLFQPTSAHDLFVKVPELHKSTVIHLPLPEISNDVYRPYNPSIVKHPDPDTETYIVNVRLSNYTLPNYAIRPNGGPYINTRNVIYVMDKTLTTVIEEHELIDNTEHTGLEHLTLPHGFEDVRLFVWKGDLYFLAGYVLYSFNFMPQVVLCHINMDTWTVDSKTHLLLDANQCEKNWLPFVEDENVFVMYNQAPLKVYHINSKTEMDLIMHKTYENIHPDILPVKKDKIRGSAGPVRVNDQFYLSVSHEHIWLYGHRFYIHRFVLHDRLFFEEEEISDPFVFFHHGIEFCCGMTMSLGGEFLILSVGVEDEDAFLVTVPVKDVMRKYFLLNVDKTYTNGVDSCQPRSTEPAPELVHGAG